MNLTRQEKLETKEKLVQAAPKVVPSLGLVGQEKRFDSVEKCVAYAMRTLKVKRDQISSKFFKSGDNDRYYPVYPASAHDEYEVIDRILVESGSGKRLSCYLESEFFRFAPAQKPLD